MTKISYLSGWDPKLCITLETEDNLKADFNRLIVKGFPTTESLKLGNKYYGAKRERFISPLKQRFDEQLEEGRSGATLYSLFHRISLYTRWCDEHDLKAFAKFSLEHYMDNLNSKVMQGSLKSSTYKQFRSSLNTIFSEYLDLPSHYFDNVIVRDNSDGEPYEAYTKSDKKQLLPFLRSLFKQTHLQFMADPEKHISAYKNKATMTFHWKGSVYPLCGGISKMMCAATYLLSYYTYANSSDLFQLKQPQNASTYLGETWYTMPTFKRRAFKTIQIEVGEHELDIPKYSIDFFDKLLTASKRISDGEDATLLKTVANNEVQPMKSRTLNDFLRKWVERNFTFTDQVGRKLRPTISRFRESGAQITAYYQGGLANSIMLGNTPRVQKTHYTKGNIISNNGMLQDTMSIREEQIKQGVSPQQAIENLGISALVIDQEYRSDFTNLSRTSNGTSCSEPFGSKSKKYTKKAITQGLIREGEKLACADLLRCFGCPSQVIVQSVADIWCLLSFKSCIEESLYLHLDASHYRKNFEQIISFIDTKIIPNISNKVIKEAKQKLNDDGLHPAWEDSDSMINLIPQKYEDSKYAD